MELHTLRVIAHVETDFGTKFGVPRQSGLVDGLEGRVVFEPEFRAPEAVRGLEQFDRIWLVWQFSQAVREGWSPTVRPPRLGGNERVGVFATRSPYRPNAIGLSCVRLARVEPDTPEGPVLYIRGADLVTGTPVYDVKPYLPYADSFPDARGGFGQAHADDRLAVRCPPEALGAFPAEKRKALLDVLSCDPRPAYQRDPARVYGMAFAGLEVKFRVDGDVLTVCGVSEQA